MSNIENMIDSSSDEDQFDSEIEIECLDGNETDVEDIVERMSDSDESDDGCFVDTTTDNGDNFISKSGMEWGKSYQMVLSIF